jgi:hypothetical protein
MIQQQARIRLGQTSEGSSHVTLCFVDQSDVLTGVTDRAVDWAFDFRLVRKAGLKLVGCIRQQLETRYVTTLRARKRRLQ